MFYATDFSRIKLARVLQRRLHLLLALALMTTAGSCNQESSQERQDAKFDAGVIFVGEKQELTHTFEIVNNTTKPINIIETHKSCNCSTLELGKSKLEPAERTTLQMTIKNLTRSQGSYTVIATIVTDDPVEKSVNYTLTYRIYNRLQSESTAINLGGFSRKELMRTPPRKTAVLIDMISRAEEPLDSIAEIKTQDGLRVKPDPEPIIDLLEGGRIRRARISAMVETINESLLPMTSGRHSSSVNILTKKGERLSIPALWEINSPVVITPNPFSFGFIGRDEAATPKHIIIRDRDNLPFRITGFRSDSKLVELVDEQFLGQNSKNLSSHEIAVRLVRAKIDSAYQNGIIVFLTDHPEQKELQLSWSAIFGPSL